MVRSSPPVNSTPPASNPENVLNTYSTAKADVVPSSPQQTVALWRLPTVLANVPISRSGWWAGVKSGRYPQPIRIGARCVAWRESDIRALIASLN